MMSNTDGGWHAYEITGDFHRCSHQSIDYPCFLHNILLEKEKGSQRFEQIFMCGHLDLFRKDHMTSLINSCV